MRLYKCFGKDSFEYYLKLIRIVTVAAAFLLEIEKTYIAETNIAFQCFTSNRASKKVPEIRDVTHQKIIVRVEENPIVHQFKVLLAFAFQVFTDFNKGQRFRCEELDLSFLI